MAQKRSTKKKLMDVAELGRQGGRTRAANLSPEERSEGARKASKARWAAFKKAAAVAKKSAEETKRKKP
jgi:hypothetical protein